MTLADFFVAVNGAGISLGNANGQLQLHGPTDAITPEIQSGAAEHKETLLAMMAPTTVPAETEKQRVPESYSDQRTKLVAALRAEDATRQQSADAARRHGRDWQDWRLEWLSEVGTLFLRMRGCRDQEILARLRSLAESIPTSLGDWLDLGRKIASIEHELRQKGKLPSYPWPERGE